MNKDVCTICGKERNNKYNVKIEGKLRICKRTETDKGGTVILSADSKDISLCERCSDKMLKCADALREHKRIKIGRRE